MPMMSRANPWALPSQYNDASVIEYALREGKLHEYVSQCPYDACHHLHGLSCSNDYRHRSLAHDALMVPPIADLLMSDGYGYKDRVESMRKNLEPYYEMLAYELESSLDYWKNTPTRHRKYLGDRDGTERIKIYVSTNRDQALRDLRTLSETNNPEYLELVERVLNTPDIGITREDIDNAPRAWEIDASEPEVSSENTLIL